MMTLLVRLRHSGEWPRDLLLLAGILRSGIGRGLGILHQRLHLVFRLSLLRTKEQLVVPCIAVVRVVLANVACRGPALLNLVLPVHICWCATLEIEVFGERKGQALIQALLVEMIGFLEGLEVAGDLGRAGEDYTGVDDVDRVGGRGSGRNL